MERSEKDSTKKKINANNTISQRVTSFFRHFNNDLAIDLGTANTIIFKGNRIELNEPSIVAYDNNTNKIIAVGRNAQGMIGRVHKDITICKPMEEGVIANPYVAEGMLRAYINRVSNGSWARRIIVGVPSGITEAGMRIMRDSCEHAGAKEVHLITEPMASAIGMGLEVLEPKGNLIVDIGGGTTEIAVIALGGIVCKESIKTAGNVITKRDMLKFLIPGYVQEGKYQLVVGIGCTGDQHRSVTIANELYERLKNSDGNFGIKISHRDVRQAK